MENVLPASLRHLSDERSVAGGKEYMSGWAYERDYHPDDVPDGFEDSEEVNRFMESRGEYNGVNSFGYTQRDLDEWSDEGFFQRPFCQKCVLEADAEEDIDAEIDVHVFESKEDSFMRNNDKTVRKYFYGCLSHPSTGITVEETLFD